MIQLTPIVCRSKTKKSKRQKKSHFVSFLCYYYCMEISSPLDLKKTLNWSVGLKLRPFGNSMLVLFCQSNMKKSVSKEDTLAKLHKFLVCTMYSDNSIDLEKKKVQDSLEFYNFGLNIRHPEDLSFAT